MIITLSRKMIMASGKIGYIRKEAAETLEVKPSLIQFYTDQGIIIPGINAPTGRGTRRIYSKRNLLEILIAKRFIEHGLSVKKVKNIFFSTRLREKYTTSPSEIDQLPDELTTDQKNQIIASSQYLNMFWGIENWDFSCNVFYSVSLGQGNYQDEYALQFLPKGHKTLSQITITEKTDSFILINITDIIEKIAKL